MELKSFTSVLIILVSSNFIPIINSKMTKTNIQFYSHDQVSGNQPTVVPIVASNVSIATSFGDLVMIDVLLTTGPEPNSTAVGRAQGMFGGADLNRRAFLMVMNFVFNEKSGYTNGSTLAMLGRNEIGSGVREMSIVGGTRDFRYAQGFALATTNWSDTAGDAINHYKITVLH